MTGPTRRGTTPTPSTRLLKQRVPGMKPGERRISGRRRLPSPGASELGGDALIWLPVRAELRRSGGCTRSGWLRFPQVQGDGHDVPVGVQEEVHAEPCQA